jgi:hypothetical protein
MHDSFTGFEAIFESSESTLYPEFLWVPGSLQLELQTPRHNQLNKETRRVIFIDEGQDAVAPVLINTKKCTSAHICTAGCA